MAAKFPDIERSGRFLLYFQATGVCDALRVAVQSGSKFGLETVRLLVALREDAQSICSGRFIERIPLPNDTSSPADLLVVAESIRTSILAFLSPEEIASGERSFSLLGSLVNPLGSFVGAAIKQAVG